MYKGVVCCDKGVLETRHEVSQEQGVLSIHSIYSDSTLSSTSYIPLLCQEPFLPYCAPSQEQLAPDRSDIPDTMPQPDHLHLEQ
jgi:hypothetical protein